MTSLKDVAMFFMTSSSLPKQSTRHGSQLPAPSRKPTTIKMATQLEKHTSREDMDRAVRLSKVRGNLPPLSSMGCSGSPRRCRSPSSALPITSFRDKTTTAPVPVAEVDDGIDESVEEE